MKRITVTTLIFALGITSGLLAQEPSGLQVIENVYNRPTGEDMSATLTMTLENNRGNERVRKISQFSKDFGDTEKKIMFFVSPADVRNTSFMTWSYDDEDKGDDQWIYLPALKKVKRISSDSKGDYFMGSDFTYDDLGDRHPLEDNHKILREEIFEGKNCYVVESIPKDEDYMYSRTVTWIIKGSWVGLKKEFYDEDGELLKLLTVDKYENIDGIIVQTKTNMHNIQRDHTTVMSLTDVVINKGIPNNKFTERMMRRGI